MVILLELGKNLFLQLEECGMATEPCSPVNKPGGTQTKGTPLPKPPRQQSPGACSSPSKGK
jgi:hypothetical protein